MILITGIISISNVLAQNNTNQSSSGQNQSGQSQKFVSTLTAQNVVPSVQDSKAKGLAEFNLNPQMNEIDYKVSVRDIDNVLNAVIQTGTAGTNGPIVVYLFRADTPTGQINGELASETIESNEFEGPMEGQTIQDFVNAINNGNLYVSITTAEYPNGEIRGTISPS
ncbi:MAG: CHRD domain-containing protein [Thermoproteota archaeon]|nr:CHRD domain-containing protein [Thermoproteota archaeon]